jgi:phosphosulfolactate synthase (CoM biosynthesis protein A)
MAAFGNDTPGTQLNERPGKPRPRGITEIRGLCYTPVGKRYLEDVLQTMGSYVDILKFAGGSFSLTPRPTLSYLEVDRDPVRRQTCGDTAAE